MHAALKKNEKVLLFAQVENTFPEIQRGQERAEGGGRQSSYFSIAM